MVSKCITFFVAAFSTLPLCNTYIINLRNRPFSGVNKLTNPGMESSTIRMRRDLKQDNEIGISPERDLHPKVNNQLINKFTNDESKESRSIFGIRSESSFLFLSAIVGVMTGGSVTLFKLAIELIKGNLYGNFVGLFPIIFSRLIVLLIPVLGGLCVVLIQQFMPKRNFGPGLGGLIEEVDTGVPFGPLKAFGKALAAVFTLGTGNSLGPEGPAVELGVASSRLVCSLREVSIERQRMLLSAGAAAGVAAGFNAPIAGVFFSLEIVGDSLSGGGALSKSAVACTLLCAAISALTARLGLHAEYALRPAPYVLASPLAELPFYLGLGVVSGLVALMFKYFMTTSQKIFRGKQKYLGFFGRIPKWIKPLIGALITGIVGYKFPQILFFGYDTLDNLLANTGKYGSFELMQLCIVKAFTTAACFGSGLVGGTFAPSLFLGATAGAFYQRVLVSASLFLPVLKNYAVPIAAAPAYAMVGAASVLAAVYRAPLTGTLLLFELTKDYDIVLPLMASAGVASLLMELVQAKNTANPPSEPKISVHNLSANTEEEQSVPVGYLEMGLSGLAKKQAALVGLTAKDALLPSTLVIHSEAQIPEAVILYQKYRQDIGVVVDRRVCLGVGRLATIEELSGEEGAYLCGIASLSDLTKDTDGTLRRPITIGEVCNSNFFMLFENDELSLALEYLKKSDCKYVPVLRKIENEGKKATCIGLISEDSIRLTTRLREALLSVSMDTDAHDS